MAINTEERQIIIDCLKFSSGMLHHRIAELEQLISESEINILYERISKIDQIIFKIEK